MMIKPNNYHLYELGAPGWCSLPFLLYKKLWVLLLPLGRRTQSFTIIHQEKQTRLSLYLEPHDYQINDVNIDSHHQYGIFGGWITKYLSHERSIAARRKERLQQLLQANNFTIILASRSWYLLGKEAFSRVWRLVMSRYSTCVVKTISFQKFTWKMT